MQSNMLRFVTLDFVLRFFRRCVVRVSFPLYIFSMHPDDGPGYPPRFGVPRNVGSDSNLRVLSLFIMLVGIRK